MSLERFMERIRKMRNEREANRALSDSYGGPRVGDDHIRDEEAAKVLNEVIRIAKEEIPG